MWNLGMITVFTAILGSKLLLIVNPLARLSFLSVSHAQHFEFRRRSIPR